MNPEQSSVWEQSSRRRDCYPRALYLAWRKGIIFSLPASVFLQRCIHYSHQHWLVLQALSVAENKIVHDGGEP